jgi:hypothetical protein
MGKTSTKGWSLLIWRQIVDGIELVSPIAVAALDSAVELRAWAAGRRDARRLSRYNLVKNGQLRALGRRDASVGCRSTPIKGSFSTST